MNGTRGNATAAISYFTNLSLGYAYASVSTFGCLGNILVIFSICRQNLYKNIHYYFVLHLAICDLCNLFAALGHSYRNFTGKNWITLVMLCKLLFLPGTFFIAGVLFMVLISILRYRATFYPLRLAVKRWKLHFISAAVYVFGVLCQIPALLHLHFEPPHMCWEEWSSDKLNITYTISLSSVQFFLPVIFLGIIYWKICRELIKQGKNIKRSSATHANLDEKTKRYLLQRLVHHRNARTFVISFIIFVCFLVAGSPLQIEFVLYTLGLVNPSTSYESEWLLVIYYVGVSAVNPIIYGTLDKRLFSFIKCGRI